MTCYVLILWMARGIPDCPVLLNYFIASIVCITACTLSDTECPWGQSGVVRGVSNPRISWSWYVTCLSKSVLWSEWSASWIPKVLNKRSMIVCATVWADSLGIAINRANRVRGPLSRVCIYTRCLFSILTLIYIRPSLSNIRWSGHSTGQFPAVFRRWQAWHSMNHFRISRLILGHQYFWRISSYVGLNATCPPNQE